jgi:hypothetical protein
MYYLILTSLLMSNNNVEVKQIKIDRFGTVMECTAYKKMIEVQMSEKLKTDAAFLDCRREL